MPSVRPRSSHLSDPATEESSPVPSKRAKLSHSDDPQQAAKSLLRGGTIAAQNHDRLRNKRLSQFDESHAVVGNGTSNGDVDMEDSTKTDMVEISSDSEDENEDDEDEDGQQASDQVTRSLNGTAKGRKSAQLEQDQPNAATETPSSALRRDGGADDNSEDDEGAPTFGELVARDDPIEVEDDEAAALVSAPSQRLTAPNSLTLTSVLSQALRTNDRQLLESCLQLNDLESIRKTIERLPSPLVATLLKKLSERLHRRPGRAGNLLIWVQWSLVAHGGYLATQSDVVRRLQELTRVIRERAAALQPLMGLKGRLDMLSAQVELRRNAQAEQQASRRSGEEDAVIYVEGEESSSSDEDDDNETPGQQLAKRITARDDDDLGEAESSGDEAMLVNGTLNSDEDEDEEEFDEDEDNLIDDEAEESDDLDAEEDDLSDEGDEDEELEEALDDEQADRPATRRSTALRGTGFARQ